MISKSFILDIQIILEVHHDWPRHAFQVKNINETQENVFPLHTNISKTYPINLGFKKEQQPIHKTKWIHNLKSVQK